MLKNGVFLLTGRTKFPANENHELSFTSVIYELTKSWLRFPRHLSSDRPSAITFAGRRPNFIFAPGILAGLIASWARQPAWIITRSFYVWRVCGIVKCVHLSLTFREFATSKLNFIGSRIDFAPTSCSFVPFVDLKYCIFVQKF